MKIVEFKNGKTEDLLGILDDIRESITSGEIQGLASVGIADDDATVFFTASSKSISRLRFIGAAESLKIWLQTEDFTKDN